MCFFYVWKKRKQIFPLKILKEFLTSVIGKTNFLSCLPNVWKRFMLPKYFILFLRTLCFINKCLMPAKPLLFIQSSISCFLSYFGLHTSYDIFYSESFFTFPGFIPCKVFHQTMSIFIYKYFLFFNLEIYLLLYSSDNPHSVFEVVYCYNHM